MQAGRLSPLPWCATSSHDKGCHAFDTRPLLPVLGNCYRLVSRMLTPSIPCALQADDGSLKTINILQGQVTELAGQKSNLLAKVRAGNSISAACTRRLHTSRCKESLTPINQWTIGSSITRMLQVMHHS